MMLPLPSKTLVMRPIGHIKGGMLSSFTLTMSPTVNCLNGDVVHLAFICTEDKQSSSQRFQICRTMVSMALFRGRPMRKCPGVRASALLPSLYGVTSGLEIRMVSVEATT